MKLIIVGAGGHASVVVDVARHLMPPADIVGHLDDRLPVGTQSSGLTVLGPVSALARFPHDAIVLAIGDNSARARIFHTLSAQNERFASLVHPSASVALTAWIGAGVVVFANCVLNPEVHIEDNVIVNTAATIDHHSVVGAHAHIAPGVHIAGGCSIGEGVAIGIGAVVKPNVRIGARTLVGAGAVVLDDLPPDVVAYGAPARVVRARQEHDVFA